MVASEQRFVPDEASPLAPLRVHDFRLLFVMQLATGLRMPMLFFTQTWYVTVNAPESQRTLLIGLLATTRGLAFLAYILFGGALADRFPRRTTLLVAHAFGFVAVVATALLLLLAPGASSGEGAWLAVMLVLFSQFGLIDAQDMPTRTAMITDVVPARMLMPAVTLNWLALPLTLLIAAPTVGWMIERFGFGATYLVGSAGHLVVLAALWRMRTRIGVADPTAGQESVLENVRAGFRYLRSDRAVRWMVFVSWFTLAGVQTTMGILVSAWVFDVLGLDAAGWGRLAVFWGAGGLLAAAGLVTRGNYGRKGAIFLAFAAAAGLAVLGFAFTHSVFVAALFFAITGAGFQIVMTLGTAIVQTTAPPHLHGRVISLLFLTRGFTQSSGVLLGALGQLIGLTVLYPVVGALVVVAVFSVIAAQQPLRSLR